MPALLLLLPQIIALIPTIESGAGSIVKFVSGIRSAAQQSGQWTPELEAAFITALIAKSSTDAWKTDAEIAAAK